jgi:periplasmic copper chaperone A
MKHARLVIGIIALVVLLTACQSSQPGMQIEDPWVRPAVLAGGNGALYLTIHNNTGVDDELIDIRSDIAQSAQIHETVQMEGDMVGMQPVDALDIPAGGSVSLEPGGYHVMLVNIPDRLSEGKLIVFRLIFEKAGELPIEAEVRDQ